MTVIEDARRILEYGPICDHCLGRFFGKRSFGIANKTRGEGLRTALALEDDIPFSSEKGDCWICGNLFDGVDAWADKIIDALEGIEYKTLLVGCRVPPMMAENEEMVWSDLGLKSPEPLKAQFNREVGKIVTALTGAEVDFKRPDIVAVCDIDGDSVEVEINPVFIYGRYRKFLRGIPQTRWHCRECRGKGCPRCNFTGKMYETSVEELIGARIIEEFEAEDAILHGAGREDIDARMLGTGRPFVVEVIHPLRQGISLEYLEEEVNRHADGKVAVTFDHLSTKREVESIKSGKAHKKYSILVEVDGEFSVNDIESSLNTLKGAQISQRTPERVSHRRADKIRKRHVIDVELVDVVDGKYVIEVVGDAGLYIKELISGDNKRTTPSLTECLGAPARVATLDVINVEGVVPEKKTEKMEDKENGTSQRPEKKDQV